MKKVLKGAEPCLLREYRAANPQGTWDVMRNDAFHNGRKAAADCFNQAIADQGGLCAYCEKRYDPGKPHSFRVEHFHPKSDSTADRNYHLDWRNMLAVCDGGTREGTTRTPLPENLSCDAYKDHFEKIRHIGTDFEEKIFNPLDLPPFPNLFAFDKASGRLEPNCAACEEAGISAVKLDDTIRALNLNCDRLKDRRRALLFSIEKNKKLFRAHNRLPDLVKFYFRQRWPEFFTVIRCCLGQAAEDYLVSIGYKG